MQLDTSLCAFENWQSLSLNMYEVGVQCIIQIDSQKICSPFNEYFISSYNIYAYLIGCIYCVCL
jgi:hypothetical protein